MNVVTTKTSTRETVAAARRDGKTVGFVPTMGAFHEGHLTLMRVAKEQCDFVVVSLFVNPTQFNDPDDLANYPSTLERDQELAAAEAVDLLFTPSRDEIYPSDFSTTVTVKGLTDTLCGKRRGTEHFDSVATVVTKLLNIVSPDRAFFGQKDAQQAAVIKRLVRDLDIPVAIEVVPTVRESDGLAMSSRNTLLENGQREQALSIHSALQAAEATAAAGVTDAALIEQSAREKLLESGVQPEYIELVDPETMQEVEQLDSEALLAVAAYVGKPRLIDNQLIRTGAVK